MARDRTKRRKSVYVKSTSAEAKLGPPPDAMTLDEVERIYADQKANYQAPEENELETLFERRGSEAGSGNGSGRATASRRCAGTEELAIGKYKAKRKLEQTPYWLEDKAKTRHRIKMSRKLGVGAAGTKKAGAKGTNNKNKLVPLTAEQEVKLATLIAEKETTAEDEDEIERELVAAADDDDEEKENSSGPANVRATPSHRKSRRSSNAAAVFKTPGASRRRSSRNSSMGPGRRPSANSTNKTPVSQRRSSRPARSSKSPSPSSFPDHFGLCTPGNPEIDVNFASVKTPASESERVRGLYAMEEAARMSKEELLRKIAAADSMFGVVAADDEEDPESSSEAEEGKSRVSVGSRTAAKKKKSDRRSVSVSVRRSSRFLGKSSAALGSVYSVAEVSESRIRGRRSVSSHEGGYGLVIPPTVIRPKGLYDEGTESSSQDDMAEEEEEEEELISYGGAMPKIKA